MMQWLLFEFMLMTIILLDDYRAHCLKLVEVRIPKYVLRDMPTKLECQYNTEGEQLYSVKWYKDGDEFYRYLPAEVPAMHTFPVKGVTVDLLNSNDSILTLKDINLKSSGRYRCEVSTEAPLFQTVTKDGNMTVILLPDQKSPNIVGYQPRYRVGEWVRANCTAGRSKPAAQLTWYVNGSPVDAEALLKYENVISGQDDLETSVLGLQFRARDEHFRYDDLKLKCVASLSSYYWRSNEALIANENSDALGMVSESRPQLRSLNNSAVIAHAPCLMALLVLTTFAICGLAQRS